MFHKCFVAVLCLIPLAVFAEDNPRVTKENFDKYRNYIKPTEKELKYRKIPWRMSFAAAIPEARAKNKPILFWNMNGHPFGCGCHNGVTQRIEIFNDEEVQKLCEEFIPVADDAVRMDCEKTYPAHEIFQRATNNEQRHQQGIYVLTASGKILGDNDWNARSVSEMMKDSLRKWNALSKKEKNMPVKINGVKPEEKLYPHNGLVLHTYSRDLPRSGYNPDWVGKEWNQDFMWFQKHEARLFVPSSIKEGQQCDIPQFIAHRIARFHLIDNVRGQSGSYEEKDVKEARLTSRIVSVKKGIAYLEFDGEGKVSRNAQLGENGRNVSWNQIGVEANFVGYAQYNISQQKFILFELVACGNRWGRTEDNFRENDLGPTPIGIVFVIAGKESGEHIPPTHIGNYNWQPKEKVAYKR